MAIFSIIRNVLRGKDEEYVITFNTMLTSFANLYTVMLTIQNCSCHFRSFSLFMVTRNSGSKQAFPCGYCITLVGGGYLSRCYKRRVVHVIDTFHTIIYLHTENHPLWSNSTKDTPRTRSSFSEKMIITQFPI